MQSHLRIPKTGQKITFDAPSVWRIPDNPIIPFIEGDGIGSDITPTMQKVVNAAVTLAYGEKRHIAWMEIYAGEKAVALYGKECWLPDETLEAIRHYHVAIKGPLTTPVGGGFRSLNVTLRQVLDLYICLRPVRYFKGIPSPLKAPENTDMILFRENSEDIYMGIEWPADSPDAEKLLHFLQNEMGITQIRFDQHCGLGLKVCSEEGSKRLVRAAIHHAIKENRDSVTLVHKGNIMKFTEGAFKKWGYEVATEEFGAQLLDGGPWMSIINPTTHKPIIIKDSIADAFLQQILLRPKEYDVIATTNLNGDYISDALAAQVGGIGIAPGANIGMECALFEATHGTAPKYANQNKVNPGSLILSAVMMLRFLGWSEAANLIEYGIEETFKNRTVTYDLARLMPDTTPLSCSEYGDAIITNMRKAAQQNLSD